MNSLFGVFVEHIQHISESSWNISSLTGSSIGDVDREGTGEIVLISFDELSIVVNSLTGMGFDLESGLFFFSYGFLVLFFGK